ncbi:Glycosyl transferase, group 1 [Nitrococcus mobilis Nb-231]|uniref:Glycosyl transferase, group 1 n=2 Tax=Nitrococcus mobilis TaxID=35797 RepID=A4BPR5_9GAMM|nr:Glycosyl transferase, group 1 [Nitrococcus mobilis Nb-231]
MRDLEGGGIQKNLLRLAESFSQQGHTVDLVVYKAKGPHLAHIPPGVNLVALGCMAFKPAARGLAFGYLLAADPPKLRPSLQPLRLAWDVSPWLKCLPALTRYLRRTRPQALLSAGNTLNCTAALARRLANTATRLVVSERNHLSAYTEGKRQRRRWRCLPGLIARTYPWADATVAVSNGVADDLALTAGLSREQITTVYNPIVSAELFERAKAPLSHTWFDSDSIPVILGVGSLNEKKDFPTLLRAFARVREQRAVRLLILGEGDGHAQLGMLAEELGVADDVALPGFTANPFAYMARAAVFVLSSVYEGLPTVLIEALACGCPVVSTNCPSGPAEILQGGRYGPLVAVGDDRALARAILGVLDNPPDREQLRRRAAEFSVERGSERYLEILLGTSK